MLKSLQVKADFQAITSFRLKQNDIIDYKSQMKVVKRLSFRIAPRADNKIPKLVA